MCVWSVILISNPSAPGRADSPQAPRLHRPHPRPRCPPHLQAAGQRSHPDVALPAVPPLPAQCAPSGADVRGLPHPLLPQVRLQGAGPLRHHRGQHDLHGDVVPHQRPRVHEAQQWGDPFPAASPDPAADKDRRACMTVCDASCAHRLGLISNQCRVLWDVLGFFSVLLDFCFLWFPPETLCEILFKQECTIL